jgi:hypothetical protein
VSQFDRQTATTSRNTVPKGEVSGVLETLAAGLSMVISRPYLLLLPLVVDLWTWLGTQVRGDALVAAMQDFLIDRGGSNGASVAEDLDAISTSLHVNDLLATLHPSIFGGLPLTSLLNLLFSFLAPAMTAGIDREDMYAPWRDGLASTVNPGSWEAVVGLSFLFLLGATILLPFFMVPLAQAVRGGPLSAGGFLKDIVMGWFRLLALGGIVLALVTVIGIPVLVVVQILLLAGINLVAVLSLILIMTLAMAALYTYFLLDAMFIYRVGPIRATRMSYAVAKDNLGSCWRFAAASILIATGLLRIWDVLIENPPGIMVAVVLNAAIGTGLSIASMMFFYDRARLPRPLNPPSSMFGRR